VLQVDADNMVRAHSASIVGGGDNEATARELAGFAAADKEKISSVADTAAGETGAISLATVPMCRLYSRFSELLLVDCTHETMVRLLRVVEVSGANRASFGGS
jgi:hypothetical protein